MGGKILVAEDDPEARELLLLLLEGGEYSLLEAADGMEALDLLRTEQPDLLITDIVMPRMDGYELVRRLRQDDRTAHTRHRSSRTNGHTRVPGCPRASGPRLSRNASVRSPCGRRVRK